MRKISTTEAVELAKNNYIKLIVKECKNQKKLDKLHQSMLISSKNNSKIEIIEASEILDSIDIKKLEENVCQNSEPIDVVKGFMNELNFDQGIDPVMVEEIMESLFKEVKLMEVGA